MPAPRRRTRPVSRAVATGRPQRSPPQRGPGTRWPSRDLPVGRSCAGWPPHEPPEHRLDASVDEAKHPRIQGRVEDGDVVVPPRVAGPLIQDVPSQARPRRVDFLEADPTGILDQPAQKNVAGSEILVGRVIGHVVIPEFVAEAKSVAVGDEPPFQPEERDIEPPPGRESAGNLESKVHLARACEEAHPALPLPGAPLDLGERPDEPVHLAGLRQDPLESYLSAPCKTGSVDPQTPAELAAEARFE